MKAILSYDGFKQAVKEELPTYLSEQYRNFEVVERTVPKRNGIVRDGIILVGKEEVGISPIVYLDEFFEVYRENYDLKKVLEEFAFVMENAMEEAVERVKEDAVFPAKIDGKYVKENIEKKIFFWLVNTENNKELLETVPHRGFLDLSIVYSLLYEKDGTVYGSSMLTNPMLSLLKMEEEQLFSMAKANTEKVLPTVVRSMAEGMVMVTNRLQYRGASVLMNDTVLSSLADAIQDDLYIMPASIDEVVIVPVSFTDDVSVLQQMVKVANETCLSLDELLSNEVYYYSKKERKVFLATCPKEA